MNLSPNVLPITITPEFIQYSSEEGNEKYILNVLIRIIQNTPFRICLDYDKEIYKKTNIIKSLLLKEYAKIIKESQSQPLKVWLNFFTDLFDENSVVTIDPSEVKYDNLFELSLYICANTPIIKEIATDRFNRFIDYEDHIMQYNIKTYDAEALYNRVQEISNIPNIELYIAEYIAREGSIIATNNSKIVKKGGN